MNYITHHRFKQKTMRGDYLNLPYGTKLICVANIIFYKNTPICYATSENAKQYFSRDNDNRGLERGALTYAIAFAPRGNSSRFTFEERNLLTEKYSHWLRRDIDYILFNDDFFNAEVEELQQLAAALNIKIK